MFLWFKILVNWIQKVRLPRLELFQLPCALPAKFCATWKQHIPQHIESPVYLARVHHQWYQQPDQNKIEQVYLKKRVRMDEKHKPCVFCWTFLHLSPSPPQKKRCNQNQLHHWLCEWCAGTLGPWTFSQQPHISPCTSPKTANKHQPGRIFILVHQSLQENDLIKTFLSKAIPWISLKKTCFSGTFMGFVNTKPWSRQAPGGHHFPNDDVLDIIYSSI